ncbi:alpha/beta hydrolase [Sphingoaurantiacus capsulatus]|uniref:Alpha/beta hydrolase n=1 Tax=Sphingoaurantiacus capsulatus TaxID=1771310 RepID=A0ABV7X6P8_9SPHN
MPFVRPDVKAFLDFLNSQPGPQMHELDAPTARMMFQAMGQIAELPRGELAHVEDISIPGDHGHAIPARLYCPATRSGPPAPVLVFYHGGGWVIGDLDTHDSACAEIARGLGMTVIAVDYRLAPEHRFPAAAEDCLAATRWVASSPSVIGHAVTGLVVAGDSAGGNLAAVCAQQLHDSLPVPILAQWLIYPGVDMSANVGSMQEFADGYLLTNNSMMWFMGHYLGEGDQGLHPHASPYHTDRFTGLPPALVYTCGLDPLRDQGRAYAAKLVEHGVPTVYREAKGQIHGSLTLRQAIPSGQGDLAGCLATLREIVNEAQGEATMAQAAQAAE